MKSEPERIQYCLIGHPVSHSLSPAIFNAGFAHLAMDESYGLVDVAPEKLEAEVSRLVGQGVRGFSVTVPHKETIIPLIDEMDSSAGLVGAVNAVVAAKGRLTGYNTDLGGLSDSFPALGVPGLAGESVLVLGAGGAARAAALAALKAGAAQVTVANRTPARAELLAAVLAGHYPAARVIASALDSPELPGGAREAVLVMNATSLGLSSDDPLPLDPSLLSERTFIYDLVYSPSGTAWVRKGRQAGLKAADGKEMLLRQAARAWKLWFGSDPPLEAMRSGMENTIGV